MIATTLEQSHKLAKLGLDISTADLSIKDENSVYQYLFVKYDNIQKYNKTLIPSWSLSALLDLLPPVVNTEFDDSELFIIKEADFYSAGYRSNVDNVIIIECNAPEALDCIYHLVRWLLEHKHL